jgi:phage gp36-like protein
MPVVTGTQYATTTDLANLGLIGGVLASIATSVQNAALIAASAIADAELAGQYILPITSWGQDLVRAVCVIAAYDLLTSRGYNPTSPADANIRLRYLDALAWLREVGDGKASPGGIIDSSLAQDGQSLPTPTDGSVVFSTEGGFQLQTTSPRGWTDRGSCAPVNDDDNGWSQ